MIKVPISKKISAFGSCLFGQDFIPYSRITYHVLPRIGAQWLTPANIGCPQTVYAATANSTANSGHFTATVIFLPKRFR